MSYVVVNLSLFVVVCTARQGFLFCNKIINPIEILGSLTKLVVVASPCFYLMLFPNGL